MVHTLSDIFADGTFLLLSAMLAGALFFLMVGLRDLLEEQVQGLLYLTLALFFIALHSLCFWTLPSEITLFPIADGASFWSWLVGMAAPALVSLLLVLGIVSIFMARFREGLVKLFFGMTLFCYLYMIGPNWPLDAKGILTMVYGGAFLETELRFFR